MIEVGSSAVPSVDRRWLIRPSCSGTELTYLTLVTLSVQQDDREESRLYRRLTSNRRRSKQADSAVAGSATFVSNMVVRCSLCDMLALSGLFQELSITCVPFREQHVMVSFSVQGSLSRLSMFLNVCISLIVT